MKRSILLVFVLTAAAQAQLPAPCLKLSKVAITGHALRQQESTIAKLTFKAQHCAVAGLRSSTSTNFESSPGLDIAVSDVGFKRSNETPTAMGIQKVQELSLFLKLSASPDLAVGEHTLHGLLTYQAIDASGTPALENLVISFPFKVAPHKPSKKVAPPDFGRPREESPFVHGLKTTGMVLLAIPIFIVLAVECLFGNCWGC